ncbi:AP-4 complex subunit sigma [Diplonema papillatum]|nr:AP-4 complex subunit sigma [Diplonema papillatum]
MCCQQSLNVTMIHFLLLVNKQGQTRLAQYANYMDLRERVTLEGEVVRKCLQRKETECSFIEHLQYKLIYRRYASLFFIVGVDGDENELAILEFIHVVVETLDKYFENVCELDVMFNLEKAHFIVEEMFCSGSIVETNKVNSLKSLVLMDRAVKK